MFTATLSTAEAIRRAEEALKVFWQVSAVEFPENMKLTWPEFLTWMQRRGQTFFIDFGKNVAAQDGMFGLSSGAALDAMRTLARRQKGMVAQYADGYPRGSEFFDALVDQWGNWTVSRVWNASKEVGIETAKKATEIGALAIGGYGAILAIGSAIGLFVVISSYRKK